MALIAVLGVVMFPLALRLLARAFVVDTLAATLCTWVASVLAVAAAWLMLIWLQR
jgi:hypothetical protein